MSWWKRVLLSLASAIFAEVLVFAAVSLRNPAGARLDGFVMMSAFAFAFVIPCWILSLPAVILINGRNGRELWTLALIGILIGPATMLAVDLWMSWHYPKTTLGWPGFWDYLALAISIVATVVYLVTLKTSSSVSIQPTT